MLSIVLSRINIFLLILVIGVGISLSILSYHYSGLTADQIGEIASNDIRSNAIIETDGLSKTLLHIIDPVSTNLEILSKIVNYSNIEGTSIIMDAVQNSTRSLTEGYYWIDENGKIVSISNVNSSIIASYSGIDLSNREYFVIPKETHASYYSSAIESIDKVPRLYISFPVLEGSNEVFKGVIVASIKIHELGRFLQSELAPQVAGNVGLMDKNGVMDKELEYDLSIRDKINNCLMVDVPRTLIIWDIIKYYLSTSYDRRSKYSGPFPNLRPNLDKNQIKPFEDFQKPIIDILKKYLFEKIEYIPEDPA